jgi:hypothetical protein
MNCVSKLTVVAIGCIASLLFASSGLAAQQCQQETRYRTEYRIQDGKPVPYSVPEIYTTCYEVPTGCQLVTRYRTDYQIVQGKQVTTNVPYYEMTCAQGGTTATVPPQVLSKVKQAPVDQSGVRGAGKSAK